MGESSTSNRNTSQVQDISMQSVTLSYQNIIKNKIELDLFRELSFDGGYDDTDEIELSFPEIDLENQIKFETNIIQKWQNNLISRDEARNEMDYEVDISDEDTFLKLVDIPKIMAQAEAKGMFAPAPAAANKKAVDTKVRPANQHGKSTGRPKFKKDSIELISKRNDELINSLLTEDGYKSSINRSTYSKKLIELTRNQFHTQLEYNIRSICDYYHLMDRSVSNLDTSLFDVYFEDFSNIIESKLDSKFISKLDDRRISTICQSISSLILEQEDKLESLAQTIVYKSLGYRTILIDAKDCEKHVSTNLEINKIDFKSLPPFSYGCNCKIEEESFHEFNFKS
jgi:hypothetical protein